MKTCLALISIFFAITGTVHAFVPEQVVSCYSGALVIEKQVRSPTRSAYQATLRSGALEYLVKLNAINISRLNRNGEYILPVKFSGDSYIGKDTAYSTEESATYQFKVDSNEKTITFISERRSNDGNKLIQHVEYPFADCAPPAQ